MAELLIKKGLKLSDIDHLDPEKINKFTVWSDMRYFKSIFPNFGEVLPARFKNDAEWLRAYHQNKL